MTEPDGTTKALAAAVGADAVIGELRRKIANERGQIASEIRGFHGKQKVAGPDPFFRWNHPESTAQQLGHHLRAALRLQAELAALDPSEPAPSPTEEARDVFQALTSGPRGREARGWLAGRWDSCRKVGQEKVAGSGRSIAWVHEQSRKRAQGFEHSQARLKEYLEEKRKYEGWLSTIGFDPAAWPAKAAAVIAAAGGVGHVVACVRAAWQVAGKWPEADGSFALLAAARAELAACTAKLAGVDARSRRAAARRAERDAAAALVEATLRSLTGRREAHARSLVGRAARADAGGVAELTALAAACPDAFPEGFATAFDCLTPSDEQLVGALEVLLTGA